MNQGDHKFTKGIKLKGPKMLFLNLGDQNCILALFFLIIILSNIVKLIDILVFVLDYQMKNIVCFYLWMEYTILNKYGMAFGPSWRRNTMTLRPNLCGNLKYFI